MHSSSQRAAEVTRRMRNGIIGIVAPIVSVKAIDIKITNTFPLIALGSRATLVTPDGREDVSEYQHVSIPPDLRVHLTRRDSGHEHHRWIADGLDEMVTAGSVRALTFISP